MKKITKIFGILMTVIMFAGVCASLITGIVLIDKIDDVNVGSQNNAGEAIAEGIIAGLGVSVLAIGGTLLIGAAVVLFLFTIVFLIKFLKSVKGRKTVFFNIIGIIVNIFISLFSVFIAFSNDASIILIVLPFAAVALTYFILSVTDQKHKTAIPEKVILSASESTSNLMSDAPAPINEEDIILK